MNILKFFLCHTVAFILSAVTVWGQARSTGINNSSPSTKAALDVQTTSGFKQGLLVPRLNEADTATLQTSITAAEKGLLFFDTDNNYYRYWNGSKWVNVGSTTALLGTGIANKVAYWNGTGTLSYSTNFHWDNVNTRLGIGTATPAYALDVVGSARISGLVGPGVVSVDATGLLSVTSGTAVVGSGAATRLSFWTGTNTLSSNTNLNWDNTNARLGIGTANPLSKLDVSGGVSIGASYAGVSTAPSNGMIVQGNVGIGTSSPLTLLTIGPNPLNATTVNELLQLAKTGDAYMVARDGTGIAVFGTTSGIPFVGSQTSTAFTIRTNNNERVRIDATGNVGIGTTTPSDVLTIRGTTTSGINLIGASSRNFKMYHNASNILTFESDDPMEFMPNGAGVSLHIDDGDMIINVPLTVNGNSYLIGNVGIGTSNLQERLRVYDTNAATDGTDGVSLQITNTTQTTGATASVVFETNGAATARGKTGIIHEDAGSNGIGKLHLAATSTATLTYKVGVADAKLTVLNTGNVGIGTTLPTKTLHIVRSTPTTDYDGGLYASSSATDGVGFYGAMVYRRNTTNFGVFAHSDAIANTIPLGVNRGSDGALVNFMSAGTTEGQITVSGTTVAYGAFTGVHYAVSDETNFERGLLVTLTGHNQFYHGNKDAEILHGIKLSTKANDSKLMGTYLDLIDPKSVKSLDNPHQIMSVGNGDMWIVDNGSDIEPGDYLISSDVRGHGMRDNGQFEIANIIARASEPVNWNKEYLFIDGIKHKKIAVFYESFIINYKANRLESELNNLKKEMEVIKTQVEFLLKPYHSDNQTLNK